MYEFCYAFDSLTDLSGQRRCRLCARTCDEKRSGHPVRNRILFVVPRFLPHRQCKNYCIDRHAEQEECELVSVCESIRARADRLSTVMMSHVQLARSSIAAGELTRLLWGASSWMACSKLTFLRLDGLCRRIGFIMEVEKCTLSSAMLPRSQNSRLPEYDALIV
jgi:hypothetical protein